jgi:hypothetical protein
MRGSGEKEGSGRVRCETCFGIGSGIYVVLEAPNGPSRSGTVGSVFALVAVR